MFILPQQHSNHYWEHPISAWIDTLGAHLHFSGHICTSECAFANFVLYPKSLQIFVKVK